MSDETGKQLRAALEVTDRFVRGEASEDEYIVKQQRDLEAQIERTRERVREAGRSAERTVEEVLRSRRESDKRASGK